MMKKEIVIDMRELIDDIKEKTDKGQHVVIKGEGVSMFPFITDKDLLTLQKPEGRSVKIGDVYLYGRSDGSFAIHRVYSKSKGCVFMLGDAQYFIEKVPESSLVAVVSKVEKPLKTVNCLSFRVRTANIVRMKLRISKIKCRCFYNRNIDRVRVRLSKIKKKLMKER